MKWVMGIDLTLDHLEALAASSSCMDAYLGEGQAAHGEG